MTLRMDELAQTLFEEAGDGLYFFDPDDGHLLDVNPMAQRLTGYTRQELLQMSVKGLFSSEVEGGMKRLFYAYQSTGLFHSQEGFLLRHADKGRTIPVNLTVTRVHARAKTLGLITARDITERRQAEVALRRSEQYYRSLFENAHDSIMLLDPTSGSVLDVNRRACELYGLERQEFLARSLPDFAQDATSELARAESLTEGACQRFECSHRRKDGTAMTLDVNSSVAHHCGRRAILTISRDMTKRKHLEGQLRQAMKMEAVGRLAGGIAHDFNNLLTVVIGFSEYIVAAMPHGHACQPMAQEILKAGHRAAELTGQLLAFGRKAIVAPKVLDLNAALRQSENLLRRLIGEDIELISELESSSPRVLIDPGQLHQVILNLCVNARDAMPQGGRLTIATQRTWLDDDTDRVRAGSRPGPYVEVSVGDTGCGMDPEVLAHIWEPFFTTKDLGKGTGLGLATVYGIVEQAGGYVDVQTQAGKGTTFRVYLPAVETALSHHDAPGLPVSRMGTETILLVEDEDNVRAYARHVLEGGGYRVLDARDGSDALELCRKHRGPLDLLVTDVVLPRFGGRELAERVLHLHPGVKVLYVSGYTDDSLLRHGVIEAEVHFLCKPFAPSVLTSKVRELLDSPGEPESRRVTTLCNAAAPSGR